MSRDEQVDEIERTKVRKTDEYEINLMEEKLRDLENKYEELEVNSQSNLTKLAMKKVEIVIAKELRTFSEDMLDRKRAIIVDEKRKLDDLHWQVWDEERKICNEISKCLTDNNSVNFLNEYPLVLKSGKYAFTAAQESGEEIKKAIKENPEIKKLSAQIAKLETEVKKAQDNCWQETLERVLAELEEFKRLNPANNSDETKRLIEALERSHRGRISLEAEIAEIECTAGADVNFGKEQSQEYEEEPEDIQGVKKETVNIGLSDDKKWLEHTLGLKPFVDLATKVDKKQDGKLKAKEWYENYACEVAVTQRENDTRNYYTASGQCEISATFKPETLVEPHRSASVEKNPKSTLRQKKKVYCKAKETRADGDESAKKMKLPQKNNLTISKPKSLTASTRSRFFATEESSPEHESGNPLPSLVPPRPKRSLDHPNELRHSGVGLMQTIPKPKRKFESLTATPSTFFKSLAETTVVDNNSVQSNYTESGTTLAVSARTSTETTQKRSGKFTLKTPSNIRNCLLYRQTKLDEFHEFMLSDINQ